MSRPRLTAIAASLPSTVPFVGPEAIERQLGQKFRARLGANESAFGPSPKALAAMAAAGPESWHYGDPENNDLLAAIARHHGCTQGQVVAGPGVDALLGLTVRLYAEPGQVVVNSLGGYPTFNYHVTGYGAQLVTVPYAGYRSNPMALAHAAREHGAAIVYLANPDNPMGSWHDAAVVRDFIAAVPETTLIILDEAYGEFAPEDARPALDFSQANLLRMRTFSKAYGMAGLRCGYILGPEHLIEPFNRIRDHFGISNVAQAAAIAALADQPFLQSVIERTNAAKARIGAIVRANGMEPLPSATNFVAVDTGRDAAFAQGVLQELASQGVFIRKPGAPGLDHCIRISVGKDDALDALEDALPVAISKLA
ncbi:pyridoxal phosphate-dependent aminotransferase [Devosia sp. RR2S18]|uniref:pyridoxal phosphate-dependent aminotransferase n=1 Tax=Devosia rhizosphaerae TaxID=3049774 RepID=UPI002540C6D3|nr:pyridoxal phosphate-dependent aminotransferase [Devosia sp. RR2S18]WIJ26568.1 pyridoxal phosphate-dependent aminotransferase [Devosia sp. RR2S18]